MVTQKQFKLTLVWAKEIMDVTHQRVLVLSQGWKLLMSCMQDIRNTVRKRYNDACARQIFEATAITRNSVSCISSPSVVLKDAESTYLNHHNNTGEI